MTREEKLNGLGEFYILNASVLIDENLTDFEKILYSLINGLSKGSGGCFASDEYFAKILSKSELEQLLASHFTVGQQVRALGDGDCQRVMPQRLAHPAWPLPGGCGQGQVKVIVRQFLRLRCGTASDQGGGGLWLFGALQRQQVGKR